MPWSKTHGPETLLFYIQRYVPIALVVNEAASHQSILAGVRNLQLYSPVSREVKTMIAKLNLRPDPVIFDVDVR